MIVRRVRHWLLAVTLLLVVASGIILWAQYAYVDKGPLQESKVLLFKKGSGFESIVQQLHEGNAIRYPLLFKVMAVVNGKARKFKAGEYEFPAGMSMRGIMQTLAGGKVIIHKLTIPEGLTSKQVMNILMRQELLEGDVSTLNLPEGSLLPETYYYTYSDLRSDLVDRMQQGMREVVKELWPMRADGLPFKTPKEALALASIVERETSLDRERPRVAAVYINRLNKGMKLQADPTVMYGLYLDSGEMPKRLLYSHLKEDSPYNSYMRTGLPPTPIANPGRASIAAVLRPIESKELYFVADGKGGHRFATTYKKHQANVARYRAALKP